MSVDLSRIPADLRLSQDSGRLHVTKEERTCQYARAPNPRGTKSEHTESGCAGKVYGHSKSGSQTCAHPLLRLKRTASPSLLPTAPRPGRTRTSSTPSLLGAESPLCRNEAVGK